MTRLNTHNQISKPRQAKKKQHQRAAQLLSVAQFIDSNLFKTVFKSRTLWQAMRDGVVVSIISYNHLSERDNGGKEKEK